MKAFSIGEFRPVILFLVKFLGIYLIGNFLYGMYVTHYDPVPDPVTRLVTEQTASALRLTGYDVSVIDHPTKATVLVRFVDKTVISVYEGCNGINTAIIFVAFLIAFGPFRNALVWFIPVGLILIHFCNILRIGGLFLIARLKPNLLHFTHKYLFTAIIYAVVFVLWICWVAWISRKQTSYGKA